jgi:hypothetical protein
MSDDDKEFQGNVAALTERHKLATLKHLHFGQWDALDPVVWAILRVVQAQNDLAHAIKEVIRSGDAPPQMVEDAVAERIKAIAALQEAIKKEPRAFQ